MLSDENQKAFANILAHTDKLTGSLASASPEVKRSLGELQITLKQATATLQSVDKLAGSADSAINDPSHGFAKQLRDTLGSVKGAADELQAKMFMILPLVMSVTFAFFPSGLVLYWVTNTLLSIAQQWNINRRIAAAG